MHRPLGVVLRSPPPRLNEDDPARIKISRMRQSIHTCCAIVSYACGLLNVEDPAFEDDSAVGFRPGEDRLLYHTQFQFLF